jgi:hypothetical protein
LISSLLTATARLAAPSAARARAEPGARIAKGRPWVVGVMMMLA